MRGSQFYNSGAQPYQHYCIIFDKQKNYDTEVTFTNIYSI